MAKDSIQPLKPAHFFILVALANQDRYGSSIQREVMRLMDGHLKLWPTLLYSTLESLLEEGWIEELSDPGELPPGTSRRRRYYRITPRGRQVLAGEAERLSGLAETARQRVADGQEKPI
ncbi:MAG: helix-turn-helix transcriptional regulator [Acidobacteriota bacterium]